MALLTLLVVIAFVLTNVTIVFMGHRLGADLRALYGEIQRLREELKQAAVLQQIAGPKPAVSSKTTKAEDIATRASA